MKQGWEIKRLDDLCQIELGKTPYRGDKSFWDAEKESDNVWLSIADMLNTEGDVVADSKEYITAKAVKVSKIVKKGTLLLSFKLTLGRLAFAGKDLFTNEAIAALTIKNEKVIDKYFLYQFLSFFDWDAAAEGDVKIKGKTLNKAKLKEIEVHFPKSLPEQKRIVAILDKAFAAIAQAKANAEQNLKNAKELFESYLQGVFENRGEGWEEKTLGEMATFRNGMNFSKSSNGEKITIVGVKDFQNSFWVPFETLETVTLDGTLNDLDLLKEGDILTVRSNGNPQLIGRTLLASEVVGKVSHSGFTIRIRLNGNNIDPIYLCNYLKISSTRKVLVDGGNGVGIKSLNQGSLSALLIPFPKSLKTQQTIVQKLDALSAETKKLEAIYQQKIKDLEELKKSILQKAFSGQLSGSGFSGLKDGQDVLRSKPNKSSRKSNPDSDNFKNGKDFKKATV